MSMEQRRTADSKKRTADRKAAVGESDKGAGLVPSRSQMLYDGDAKHLSRMSGIAVGFQPRPGHEDRGMCPLRG